MDQDPCQHKKMAMNISTFMFQEKFHILTYLLLIGVKSLKRLFPQKLLYFTK